jgi:membrane-associated protease RseP (regulator of RpoE activity)
MSDNSLSPSSYEIFDPARQETRVHVVLPPRRRYWLHALLFFATLLSTLCIGARLQDNFDHNLPAFSQGDDYLPWSWALGDWRRLALGIPFSLCLLGILTAHELGHYVLCVRRRVQASLPYFIPAPTLIGTLGAFIRIKSPIQSRKDLFDIGIAGPIAGFVVAVPVLFFAVLASKPMAPQASDTGISFGLPLIFQLAHWMLASLGSHSVAIQYNVTQLYLSPIGIAAWVGMFATALNLLPGGQLDGGHIIFAVNPRAHRTTSLVAIVILLVLAWYFWAGWLLWAVVLRLTGRHPQVPEWPGLNRKRKLLAAFGLLMLILTFAYNPLPGSGLVHILRQIRGH